MTCKVNSVEEGRKRIANSLNDGTALEKFKQMLIKLNVEEKIANELCYGNTAAVLPMSTYEVEIKSSISGYYTNPQFLLTSKNDTKYKEKG